MQPKLREHLGPYISRPCADHTSHSSCILHPGRYPTGTHLIACTFIPWTVCRVTATLHAVRTTPVRPCQTKPSSLLFLVHGATRSSPVLPSLRSLRLEYGRFGQEPLYIAVVLMDIGRALLHQRECLYTFIYVRTLRLSI